MAVLDLFTPTKTRNFTYYDRCAILLDEDELRSSRLRVSVTILGSPLERSLNLKYPYFKEFYGYAQFFYLGALYDERSINYTNQDIWDYWNVHSTLAFQLAQIYSRLSKIEKSVIDTLVLLEPPPPTLDVLLIAQTLAAVLPKGLVVDDGINAPYVNTFVHPWNLLRFKFPIGTVFSVAIDSWTMTADEDVELEPGNPEVDPPFDTDNPNGTPPERTPGNSNPGQPYGANPPPSSPLDPRLDPNDFSNAPEPLPPGDGISVRGWFIPGIPQQQSEGYAVTCADVTDLNSVPILANVQQEEDLGVACVPVDEFGAAVGSALEEAFPGFVAGDSFNLTGPDCPSCT